MDNRALQLKDILIDILIWTALFFLLGTKDLFDKKTSISIILLEEAFLVLLLAPVSYVNHRWLLPLFQKKRYHYYIGRVTLMLLMYGQILSYLVNFITSIYNSNEDPLLFGDAIGLLSFILITSTATKAIRNNFQQEKRLALLENQLLKIELKALREQVNPHFFFNTLNNLYSLSIEKSPECPGMILKLAEIMRYVLYKSDRSKVPLEWELNYIYDYIELQKIRLRYPDSVSVSSAISQDALKLNIPPLLLIIFIENAFKHSVHTNKQEKMISIDISVDVHIFHFKIENQCQAPLKQKDSGIGIVNVKRRLALLYPDQFDLVINRNDNSYSAKLKLILDGA